MPGRVQQDGGVRCVETQGMGELEHIADEARAPDPTSGPIFQGMDGDTSEPREVDVSTQRPRHECAQCYSEVHLSAPLLPDVCLPLNSRDTQGRLKFFPAWQALSLLLCWT